MDKSHIAKTNTHKNSSMMLCKTAW